MNVLNLKEVEVRVDLVERLAGGQEYKQLLSAESVAADARLPAQLSRLHGEPVKAGYGVRHGTRVYAGFPVHAGRSDGRLG